MINKKISSLKLVSFRLTMYSNNTTASFNDTAANKQIPLTIEDIGAPIVVTLYLSQACFLHLEVLKKLLTYDSITRRPRLFFCLGLVNITFCVPFVWGVTLENSSSRSSEYSEEISYTKRKFTRKVLFYHILLINFITIDNIWKIRFVYRYEEEKIKNAGWFWIFFPSSYPLNQQL